MPDPEPLPVPWDDLLAAIRGLTLAIRPVRIPPERVPTPQAPADPSVPIPDTRGY